LGLVVELVVEPYVVAVVGTFVVDIEHIVVGVAAIDSSIAVEHFVDKSQIVGSYTAVEGVGAYHLETFVDSFVDSFVVVIVVVVEAVGVVAIVEGSFVVAIVVVVIGVAFVGVVVGSFVVAQAVEYWFDSGPVGLLERFQKLKQQLLIQKLHRPDDDPTQM
jgi:hypothetical protein